MAWHQTIENQIWTNDDLADLRIYVLLGHNELQKMFQKPWKQ